MTFPILSPAAGFRAGTGDDAGNEPCCSKLFPGHDVRKHAGSARPPVEGRMRNAMSVDVEDWFHPEAQGALSALVSRLAKR